MAVLSPEDLARGTASARDEAKTVVPISMMAPAVAQKAMTDSLSRIAISKSTVSYPRQQRHLIQIRPTAPWPCCREGLKLHHFLVGA
jgi:hypothetical protein